jgi:hypothetical protein
MFRKKDGGISVVAKKRSLIGTFLTTTIDQTSAVAMIQVAMKLSALVELLTINRLIKWVNHPKGKRQALQS